ncbi:hypothetical protein SUDANB58_04118 [Streptomyces sp. enrichment culture]
MDFGAGRPGGRAGDGGVFVAGIGAAVADRPDGVELAAARAAGGRAGRFLRARCTRTNPQRAGLTIGTGIRRTPGLRREELATLAGIGIDYYVRLERGRETRPGPAVLDALALCPDDREHQHLHEIAARAARYVSEPPPAPSRTVRSHLELLLESVRPNPACVISRNMDMPAWNPGGFALTRARRTGQPPRPCPPPLPPPGRASSVPGLVPPHHRLCGPAARCRRHRPRCPRPDRCSRQRSSAPARSTIGRHTGFGPRSALGRSRLTAVTEPDNRGTPRGSASSRCGIRSIAKIV